MAIAPTIREQLDELQADYTGGLIPPGILVPPATYVPGTDATAILQSVANAARDAAKPWALRGGVPYTVLGEVITYTDLDLNGGTILTRNSGQSGAAIKVAPIAADVQNVSLATANTWTLRKGSSYIPELAGQRGWTYTIDGGDVDIQRSTGSNRRQQQTFTVVTDDGQISTPLRVAFTQPFNVATVVTRQFQRAPVTVSNGAIRITSSTGSTAREKLVHTTRCNTKFVDISIFNEASLEILQGFVHDSCERVQYENCNVAGLHINATNYAWNGNIATDITYQHCHASGGRRNIDGHSCCDYRVIGGNYPDGIGAHWLHGLYLDGLPTIGASNSNNPYCIQMAGSDLIGAANFQLDNGSFQAVKIRGDIFELSGTVDLRGSVFTIDNSDNQIGAASPDVFLVRLGGPNSGYDTGRAIALPSSIDMTDITVKLIGDCNFFIRPLVLGFAATDISFPQNVAYAGVVRLSPKLVDVPNAVVAGCSDAGYVGLPPIRVDYIRNQTSIGAGYDIRIDGIPHLRFYGDAGAVDSITDARAKVRVFDLESSIITARYGGVKSMKLARSAPPSIVQISDGTNGPVGDELFSFDEDARAPAANIAAGRYFFAQGHSSNTTTAAVASGTLYLFAFDKTVDIDALAFELTAGAAGSARAGIYSSDAKGRPYRLIEEAAPLADTNTTGIMALSLAAARRLTGRVWLAMLFSGTPTLRLTAVSAPMLNDTYGRGGFNTSTADAYLTATLAYGALPVNCPKGTAVAASTAPALAVRAA